MSESEPTQEATQAEPVADPNKRFGDVRDNVLPFRRKPGQGFPGMNGRRACLMELDLLLAKPGNRRKLRKAWQTLFDANPAGFFQKIVAPLLPKEFIAKIFTDGATPGSVGGAGERRITINIRQAEPPAGWDEETARLISAKERPSLPTNGHASGNGKPHS